MRKLVSIFAILTLLVLVPQTQARIVTVSGTVSTPIVLIQGDTLQLTGDVNCVSGLADGSGLDSVVIMSSVDGLKRNVYWNENDADGVICVDMRQTYRAKIRDLNFIHNPLNPTTTTPLGPTTIAAQTAAQLRVLNCAIEIRGMHHTAINMEGTTAYGFVGDSITFTSYVNAYTDRSYYNECAIYAERLHRLNGGVSHDWRPGSGDELAEFPPHVTLYRSDVINWNHSAFRIEGYSTAGSNAQASLDFYDVNIEVDTRNDLYTYPSGSNTQGTANSYALMLLRFSGENSIVACTVTSGTDYWGGKGFWIASNNENVGEEHLFIEDCDIRTHRGHDPYYGTIYADAIRLEQGIIGNVTIQNNRIQCTADSTEDATDHTGGACVAMQITVTAGLNLTGQIHIRNNQFYAYGKTNEVSLDREMTVAALMHGSSWSAASMDSVFIENNHFYSQGDIISNGWVNYSVDVLGFKFVNDSFSFLPDPLTNKTFRVGSHTTDSRIYTGTRVFGGTYLNGAAWNDYAFTGPNATSDFKAYQPCSVMVQDPNGNPVIGAEVRWTDAYANEYFDTTNAVGWAVCDTCPVAYWEDNGINDSTFYPYEAKAVNGARLDSTEITGWNMTNDSRTQTLVVEQAPYMESRFTLISTDGGDRIHWPRAQSVHSTLNPGKSIIYREDIGGPDFYTTIDSGQTFDAGYEAAASLTDHVHLWIDPVTDTLFVHDRDNGADNQTFVYKYNAFGNSVTAEISSVNVTSDVNCNYAQAIGGIGKVPGTDRTIIGLRGDVCNFYAIYTDNWFGTQTGGYVEDIHTVFTTTSTRGGLITHPTTGVSYVGIAGHNGDLIPETPHTVRWYDWNNGTTSWDVVDNPGLSLTSMHRYFTCAIDTLGNRYNFAYEGVNEDLLYGNSYNGVSWGTEVVIDDKTGSSTVQPGPAVTNIWDSNRMVLFYTINGNLYMRTWKEVDFSDMSQEYTLIGTGDTTVPDGPVIDVAPYTPAGWGNVAMATVKGSATDIYYVFVDFGAEPAAPAATLTQTINHQNVTHNSFDVQIVFNDEDPPVTLVELFVSETNPPPLTTPASQQATPTDPEILSAGSLNPSTVYYYRTRASDQTTTDNVSDVGTVTTNAAPVAGAKYIYRGRKQ